jgi:hypothetical protein
MRRFLVPLSQTLVVLDTNPARNIAEEGEPAWVEVFARMRDAGYVFCLADAAFAELLTQRCKNAINDAGYSRMIASLERFIDPQLPVLLGKCDVLGMLGVRDQQMRWSAEEVWKISREGWERLKRAKPGDFAADVEIEEERADYRDAFKVLADAWEASDRSVPLHEYDHPQLDKALSLQKSTRPIRPGMHVRNDLQVRWLWRQFVRSQLPKHAYDPESRKRRNDGIDFDLFRYLALPALVVSGDEVFFEKLKDIDSLQKKWFWKPAALASAFERGELAAPRWQ